MTETKKNMIIQSLDTAIKFLKNSINDKKVMNAYIKPKDLYIKYADFVNEGKNKEKPLNKEHFMERLKDQKEIITFTTKKIDGGNTTNYIYINREKLIDVFTKKHCFNEYDDIHVTLKKNPDDDEDDETDNDEDSQSLFKGIQLYKKLITMIKLYMFVQKRLKK